MSEKTINEALIMIKSIRERLGSLRQLRNHVAVKETYFGTKEKLVEPTYDVRKVDLKIVQLENFLYEADAAIKASNARTMVELRYELGDLLSPLE